MKSSSVASSLKQEQVDASKLQEGVLNNLELRLGISSDNGPCDVGGTSSWPGVGVHPWSLSAKQDKAKAALEQDQQRPNECNVQREDRPQLVGWPPVCAFRKNLSTTSTRLAYSEDLSKLEPCSEEEDHGSTGVSGQDRPAMFVKVNLEGYAVGRKIDINAHRGYTSLYGALQSMFDGFLSDGHGRITTREDEERLDYQKGKGMMKNYILLYEDNEGDRMLVGDVPWELFITSVKRLYITKDPRADKATRRTMLQDE